MTFQSIFNEFYCLMFEFFFKYLRHFCVHLEKLYLTFRKDFHLALIQQINLVLIQ